MHNQMLSLRARVDLGTMAMKKYSAFPKAPALLESYHQIVSCHIQDTCCGGSLIPWQRCSRCILQLQLAEPSFLDIIPLIIKVFTEIF